MGEPFIGEVRATSWNLAPKGWAFCDGQLLSIAQNQALFSILGTTYGGDGRTTFALPNLKGRVPIGEGNGTSLGEAAGSTSVTLTTGEIPSHTHGWLASSTAGTEDPGGKGTGVAKVYGPSTSAVNMATSTLAATGGSQPHDNMQPYLSINYIIALQGIFPSRG